MKPLIIDERKIKILKKEYDGNSATDWFLSSYAATC